MTTTIYSKTLTGNSGHYEGYCDRFFVHLTGDSLGQIRVTFTAGASGLALDHAAVAIVGTATAPNTQATPTPLKFSGNAGFVIGAAASIVSDWVTFACASTDILGIIIDYTASGSAGTIKYVAEIGSAFYDKAATASYNQSTVTGFTLEGAYTLTPLVETQAVPSSNFIFQPFAI